MGAVGDGEHNRMCPKDQTIGAPPAVPFRPTRRPKITPRYKNFCKRCERRTRRANWSIGQSNGAMVRPDGCASRAAEVRAGVRARSARDLSAAARRVHGPRLARSVRRRKYWRAVFSAACWQRGRRSSPRARRRRTQDQGHRAARLPSSRRRLSRDWFELGSRPRLATRLAVCCDWAECR